MAKITAFRPRKDGEYGCEKVLIDDPGPPPGEERDYKIRQEMFNDAEKRLIDSGEIDELTVGRIT